MKKTDSKKMKVSHKPPKAVESIEAAYDRIAESWNERRSKQFSALHFFIAEFGRRFSRRGLVTRAQILEAGCGNARNAIAVSRALPAATMYCCDISTGMVRAASENICSCGEAHRFLLSKASVENMPYPNDFFDAVVCIAVLHHLTAPKLRQQALNEISRVLKTGGFAFITVWNRRKLSAKKDLLVPWPTGDGEVVARYYHFFSPGELSELAKKSGLAVRETFFESDGKKVSGAAAATAQNFCMIVEKMPRKPAPIK